MGSFYIVTSISNGEQLYNKTEVKLISVLFLQNTYRNDIIILTKIKI